MALKINIKKIQLNIGSSKFICFILFSTLFLSNCANKNYHGIKNQEFISKRNSPKVIGEYSLKLSKSKFEFINNERVVWGSTEPNVKGFSGEYRIEGERLILNTQYVICCNQFVEYSASAKYNKEEQQLKNSRFIDCSYDNYDISYLTEIGLKYNIYGLDTLKIESSNGQVKLINNRREFIVKKKHNR